MAQRRMFSMKVIDTDAFCDMPASAQNLYFQIGMRADDDGFYAGVKGLMAKIHSGNDDLNVLLARRFILDREDGVYVVKHWKMNNYLQSDRYTPTEYQEKKAGLFMKPDGSYTTDEAKAGKPCIQNVYKMYTQGSVVKSSSVKNTDTTTERKDNPILSLPSAGDGSKEGDGWDGLDSHGVIELFVRKGWVRDDEEVRSMYIGLIQELIGRDGFAESVGKVCPSVFAESAAKGLDSSATFARVRDALLTMVGGLRPALKGDYF